MSVTIRPAGLSDADAIATLTTQLGYAVERSPLADRLSRLLGRADQRILVADHGGQAVGWIHMVASECLDAAPFVTVAGLVVDREYRRQGIGRQLLETAEAWALERGISVVRLSSSVRRTEAHRFYQRAGYTNLKTQFSFAKALGTAGPDVLRAFVPDIT